MSGKQAKAKRKTAKKAAANSAPAFGGVAAGGIHYRECPVFCGGSSAFRFAPLTLLVGANTARARPPFWEGIESSTTALTASRALGAEGTYCV